MRLLQIENLTLRTKNISYSQNENSINHNLKLLCIYRLIDICKILELISQDLRSNLYLLLSKIMNPAN